MKTCIAVVAVLTALVAPAAHSQSKEALQAAQRLVVSSGTAEQLKFMPKHFEPELELSRGVIPAPLIAALGEAVKQSFVPEVLQEDITRTLAGRMALADMKEAIAWLETPAGRRVTRAEISASSTITPQALQAYADALKRRPPTARRSKLIADLVIATRGIEHTANLTEGVALGIAMGMDATQPVQNRQSVRTLQEKLRSSLPPEELRKSLADAVPGMYGYMYRGVGDADLGAYLEFNRSALGTRYNEAVMEAFTGAMLRAALRMGPAIEKFGFSSRT
jgi:hypothetical protein